MSPVPVDTPHWHHLSTDEVLAIQSSRREGLSSTEAGARLDAFGPNLLAEEPPIPVGKILVHQFVDPLIAILLVAALLTTAIGHLIDTGVILAVVVVNAVIGFFQEHRAEHAIRALARLSAPQARVVRDGEETMLPAAALVPGDILMFESGSILAADVRLIEAVRLTVDESLLTGESQGTDKHTHPIPGLNLSPGDRRNMGFMGCTVQSGRGVGVVVATARNTLLGGIADSMRAALPPPTPLQSKMTRFSNQIAVGVVGLAVLTLGVGIALGQGWTEMFLVAVALAVSAVPEGLPIAVTATLAIGIRRMARQHAIIRRLPAAETLGSTTVIGSDKTGTLTLNAMTVRALWTPAGHYAVSGEGYNPEGEIHFQGAPVDLSQHPALTWLLRIGALASEAHHLLDETTGQYRIQGDPTEVALLVLARKGGMPPQGLRMTAPQLAILPFESEQRLMATRNRWDDAAVVLVKGAPEVVLPRCIGAIDPSGATTPIDREAALVTAHNLAGAGHRILALAYRPDLTSTTLDAEELAGLTLAGLVGIEDPPRPEAIAAVKQCRQAGIRVLMLTGDHGATAAAIAHRVGIVDRQDARVIDGAMLAEMDDDALDAALTGGANLFARVSPQDKFRIVDRFVAQGEVVAVTGDGVNDAPALKRAHIGIAMGKGGTDVAREAADMVIVDDNFATIVGAVREGRIVFDNIRKVTFFLVSSGVGEILTIIAALALLLPLPFLPAQLLWLNLVTNGFQDLALAFEPGEKGVERRPSLGLKAPILDRVLLWRLLWVGLTLAAGTLGLFAWSLAQGGSLAQAQTMALTVMVLFQLVHAFNCRSETISAFSMNPTGNRVLFFSVAVGMLAQIAVVYWPAWQTVFRTEALTAWQWLMATGVALSLVGVVELDKLMRRRWLRRGD